MKRSPQDEYAEAFRRGYERARAGHEPTVRLERRDGTRHDAGDGPRAPGRPRSHLVAAVVAAVLLVVAAFGVGRLVAGSDGAADPGGGSGDGSAGGERAEAPVAPYQGAVAAVDPVGAEATCQSAASVDEAGTPVTYEPARAHDSDLSTAWRCDGSGAGQRFTIVLPEGTEVAEVGLVPGYAKTDPVSGVDRYAENNRITRVRWHLGDGSTHVQELGGGPGDRSMRTMRVPATETGRVVVEILSSEPGRRDTVAISEIRVAAPTRG